VLLARCEREPEACCLTLVNGLLDQVSEAVRVAQRNRAPATLEKAATLKRLEFACDGLSPRADARGDFRMRGRRRNNCAA
jgi:hypothetical protein